MKSKYSNQKMSYRTYTIDEIKKIIDDDTPFCYSCIINHADIGTLPLDSFEKYIKKHSYLKKLDEKKIMFISEHTNYVDKISDFDKARVYDKLYNLKDFLNQMNIKVISGEIFDLIYGKLCDINQVLETLHETSLIFALEDNYNEFMLIHMNDQRFRSVAKTRVEHMNYMIIKIL